VVHAWIASSAGITMPVNQFPLSVLPSVDLGDAKVYGLRGTADDRSRASFEADQVCQIPADSGSQDSKSTGVPSEYNEATRPKASLTCAHPSLLASNVSAVPVAQPRAEGLGAVRPGRWRPPPRA
jgi:hypothetical protein